MHTHQQHNISIIKTSHISLSPTSISTVSAQDQSIFHRPVIPCPSVSRSMSPPNRISTVYNPIVANVLIHLHVRKFPTQAPPPPKIQVQLPPVDAAGVNVERSKLVYVAIKIMGEYKMKTFINWEDYILVLWRG